MLDQGVKKIFFLFAATLLLNSCSNGAVKNCKYRNYIKNHQSKFSYEVSINFIDNGKYKLIFKVMNIENVTIFNGVKNIEVQEDLCKSRFAILNKWKKQEEIHIHYASSDIELKFPSRNVGLNNYQGYSSNIDEIQQMDRRLIEKHFGKDVLPPYLDWTGEPGQLR